MTQAGSRPTIFNIAGNRVGLNVIPHGPAQHVAGQPTSYTPHKQGSLQGVSPLRSWDEKQPLWIYGKGRSWFKYCAVILGPRCTLIIINFKCVCVCVCVWVRVWVRVSLYVCCVWVYFLNQFQSLNCFLCTWMASDEWVTIHAVSLCVCVCGVCVRACDMCTCWSLHV